jgi:hypothetical protein
MTSFVVDGIQGTIDQENRTVTVMMPTGADLSNLSPVIGIPEGAKVTPASGKALDFRYSDKTPVEYSVMNGNLYNAYKVVVKEIKAEITSFIINGRTGVINQSDNTILVMMPESTDLTNLVPVVKYTDGAVITPEEGSIVDFTDPVTYSLTYMNQTFTYTVTAEIGGDLNLPLVIYNGEDVSPEWWTVGSAGDISTFDNPNPSAINSTAKCISIWRNPGDEPWTGGGLGGLDIDPTVYNKFTLVLLKETAGNVQMEIQGEGAGNQYLKAMYSGDAVGQWQKLEFVLPENHGWTKIHTILVAPQVDDTKEDPSFQGQRMYWDQLIAYPKQ